MNKFQFKGLMCPVFTPFTHDKKGINYQVIDKYCNHLKTKGVQCVLVNGVVGEGTCLRIDEHKRLAEEWLKVCRKYGIKMVLCIGGCGVEDVFDLCEHAEKIAVDCIVLMPDLFYKPHIEEDLVDYIKNVCKYCPNRPLYYYHIPHITNVKLNMLRLHELIGKTCQNWCGIFYNHANTEMAHELLKTGCHVIICSETLLPGLITLGFNAFCMMSFNICPERIVEIYNYMCNWKVHEAYETYNKFYDFIKDICNKQISCCDCVEIFKSRFNKMVDFDVGPTRKPKCTPFNTCKKN